MSLGIYRVYYELKSAKGKSHFVEKYFPGKDEREVGKVCVSAENLEKVIADSSCVDADRDNIKAEVSNVSVQGFKITLEPVN